MLQRINLVPGLSDAERLRRFAPVFLGIVFLFAAFVLFSGVWFFKWRAERLDREISGLKATVGQSEELQNSLLQLSTQIKTLQEQVNIGTERANQLSGRFLPKPDFSGILADISRLMPTSLRCEKIVINREGGSIDGQAAHYRDLPKLAEALRRNPRFTSVYLKELDRGGEAEGNLFRFSVTFGLQQARKVDDLSGGKSR